MNPSDYTLARHRAMADRYKPAWPWLEWLLCAAAIAALIAICWA